MSVLIKICGINSAEAADAAARAGADFVGLNFYPASPRYVTMEKAHALAERLRGRVRLVALLCDPNDEALSAAISNLKPDLLQLHGRETPERVGAIRARFGVPVIKAVQIAEASDVLAAQPYQDSADMMMFDAKAPEGASRGGGHGAAFDWQLLRGQRFARPWLLAGGLNPENVARAIASTAAPAVDVSSGVETAPGQKSPELIRSFIANARNAQYATEGRA